MRSDSRKRLDATVIDQALCHRYDRILSCNEFHAKSISSFLVVDSDFSVTSAFSFFGNYSVTLGSEFVMEPVNSFFRVDTL